jgi:hypothetical protein
MVPAGIERPKASQYAAAGEACLLADSKVAVLVIVSEEDEQVCRHSYLCMYPLWLRCLAAES